MPAPRQRSASIKLRSLNQPVSVLDTLQCTALNDVTESERVRAWTQADIPGCQPAEQKDAGILNSSIENGLASIDIGLRFHVRDQIASVLNQDETLSRIRIDIGMAVDCERRRDILQPGRSVRGVHTSV